MFTALDNLNTNRRGFDKLCKFSLLSRVRFVQIRDSFVMLLFSEIELFHCTSEFLIREMQRAFLAYRIKHGSYCDCAHCYEQRPHNFLSHITIPKI